MGRGLHPYRLGASASRGVPQLKCTGGGRMSPLFRKNQEKAALEAAAQAEMQAEIGHLKRLSVRDLAVELLPGLGADAAKKGRQLRVQELGMWLFRDFPRHIE